ncbi:hypothetical protein FRC03_007222 [Tulasnella sp. 419]|nr:hypothetical protein FRC03_007222 [Tulasnella sp. 419]
MAPLPPHWALNISSPHLSIPLRPFWISAWLGILGITIVHVSIGTGLEEMTVQEDIKFLTWKNLGVLGGVVLGAVIIPIMVRRWWNSRHQRQHHHQPNMGVMVRQHHSEEELTQFKDSSFMDPSSSSSSSSSPPMMSERDGSLRFGFQGLQPGPSTLGLSGLGLWPGSPSWNEGSKGSGSGRGLVSLPPSQESLVWSPPAEGFDDVGLYSASSVTYR